MAGVVCYQPGRRFTSSRTLNKPWKGSVAHRSRSRCEGTPSCPQGWAIPSSKRREKLRMPWLGS
jgi:hypothetical protein